MVNEKPKFELIQGDKPKCPICGCQDSLPSYGFAAGGLGSYLICSNSHTYDLVPDEEALTRVEDILE